MKAFDQEGNYIGYITHHNNQLFLVCGAETSEEINTKTIRRVSDIDLFWAKELADYSFAAAFLSVLGYFVLITFGLFGVEMYALKEWFTWSEFLKMDSLTGLLPLGVLILTPAALLLRIVMSVTAYLHNQRVIRLVVIYFSQLLFNLILLDFSVFLIIFNILCGLITHWMIRDAVVSLFPEKRIRFLKYGFNAFINKRFFPIVCILSGIMILGSLILLIIYEKSFYLFFFICLVFLTEVIYYKGMQEAIDTLV